jgi:diguanylate cyclase (GGDEF)-like protein
MKIRNQGMLAAPGKLIVYLLVIEALALTGVIVALAHSQWSTSTAARAAMLVVLAVAFEEFTRKSGTLRIKLSEHLKPDMTSVWACAAAIALPPAYVMAVVSALLLYVWLRLQRPAGEPFYRKLAVSATFLIACLAAHAAIQYVRPELSSPLHSLGDSVAIVVGLAVFTVVNRALVTGALILLGARGRDLLASRDDNLIELATLCLGGMTALAVLHQPWLTVLVLLPMSLLQRSAVVHQLEIAATTDAKTGLWTAIAWEELSQRELARSHRDEQPVAVLMLDVDRFKSVNDTYGHMVGDVVLKAVGHQLKTELRGYDLVGRLGGEEFVALLPGVDEQTALAIAERVRASLAEVSLAGYPRLESASAEAPSTVTVSIGVACSPMHGGELPELMHASDAALYAAKHAGRNRVVLAGARAVRSETEDIRLHE